MSTQTLTGGCACGAVRYRVEGEPILAAHCHCRDCQRSSGAAMSTVFAVMKTAFHKEQGALSSYQYTGDSGNPVVRYFCPHCGSPLFTDVAVMAEVQFVRAVSLDNPADIAPTMHIYCDSAQAWDRSDDGLPRFPKMPG